MKKFLTLLVLLLPALATAQHTTVTAAIQNGGTYANCTGSASFVGENGGSGIQYTLSGSVFQTVLPFNCDSSGRLGGSTGISVSSNTAISPTPSQWRFSVCSASGYVGGPYCFNVLVTISGASQDISATLNAVAPVLPSAGGITPPITLQNQIPGTTPAGYAGLSVLLGPAGFSAGNPAANATVDIFGEILCPDSRPCWASNISVICSPASGSSCNGQEVDVDTGTTGHATQAQGVLAVANGQQVPIQSEAFVAEDSQNPTNWAWGTDWLSFPTTSSTFTFTQMTTGLQIVPAITASGAVQAVNSNFSCGSAPPFPLQFDGLFISVDTGGNQEDVQTVLTGCNGGLSGTWNFSGIFTKNHAANTTYTPYAASHIWDSSAFGPTRAAPFLLFDIHRWCLGSVPQIPDLALYNASATLLPFLSFDCSNNYFLNSIGAGWTFKSQAGAAVLAVPETGAIIQAGVAFASLPAAAAGTQQYCTDCQVTTAASCSTNTPASCVCKASGNGAWAKAMNYQGNGLNWYCQ